MACLVFFNNEGRTFWVTLLGTNISHPKAVGKMSFLSHWWDMLVPWRVISCGLHMVMPVCLEDDWKPPKSRTSRICFKTLVTCLFLAGLMWDL